MTPATLRNLDDTRLRDVLLIALTVSMGSLDAISYLGLGKVFSAFQTGNIVFLGLGTGGASASVARAGISLAAFGLGALIATRIVLGPSPKHIWPRQVTVALGGVTVSLLGFLVFWLLVNGRPSGTSADLLIAISALAAGMQTGAMLRLGVRAVFTTAATATWTALMSDIATDIAHRRAVDLARLAMVVVAAFGGAAAGAALITGPRDVAPVVATALTALVTVTAAVRFEPILRHPSSRRAATESEARAPA